MDKLDIFLNNISPSQDILRSRWVRLHRNRVDSLILEIRIFRCKYSLLRIFSKTKWASNIDGHYVFVSPFYLEERRKICNSQKSLLDWIRADVFDKYQKIISSRKPAKEVIRSIESKL